MFDDFERVKFPEESCSIQNAREKDILDSVDVYLCIIVDKRWPTQCRLEHLHPYTAKDLDSEKRLFGWVRIDFDGYVDHITNPIHFDDERVVAWKKVEAPGSFMPSKWPDGA